MAAKLTITNTGSGTQNATQDPQTAGSSTGAGTSSSSIQPGSVGSLDTTTGGVPLSGSKLSTIPLSQTSTTVVKADTSPHHSSFVATGLSILFFVLAAALLIAIFVPSKSTTN